MSVIYIKMFTGDDIIATMIDETNISITITNPVVVKVRVGSDRVQFGIAPWIPINELMGCEYNILKYNTVAVTEVPPKVLHSYTEMIRQLQQPYSKEDDDDDMFMPAASNTVNRILH